MNGGRSRPEDADAVSSLPDFFIRFLRETRTIVIFPDPMIMKELCDMSCNSGGIYGR